MTAAPVSVTSGGFKLGGTTTEFVPKGRVANTAEQFPDLDDDDDQPKKKKGGKKGKKKGTV